MSTKNNLLPEIHVGLKGFYTLQVRDSEGGLKSEAYFQNLITDAGLNMLGGSNAFILRMALGTGTSTPSASDTTLTSLAMVNSNAASATAIAAPSPPYKVTTTWTQQSTQGGVAGTWTEVAVGTGTGQGNFLAFSRALIQDSLGNPTSITILPTEFLTVSYTLELIVPTEDVTGVIGSRTFTLRAMNAATASTWGMYSVNNMQPFGSGAVIAAYTGGLAAITSTPLGTLSGNATVQFNTYVANSFELTASATFQITQAVGVIRTFRLPPSGVTNSASKFQCEIDPPLTKDNTQTLTVGCRFTWGRAI